MLHAFFRFTRGLSLFLHSPFDRHTAAARGSGISADLPIEELAAERRKRIQWTGYCSSDIGSRNKKVAARSVAGGSVVTSDTFDTDPVSSFPPGYRLRSRSVQTIRMLIEFILTFLTSRLQSLRLTGLVQILQNGRFRRTTIGATTR